MDAKKLEPLREMAKKWRAIAKTNDEVANRATCDADRTLLIGRREVRRLCADELDAFCDAAEAWLKEQYPYATKTRRVLLGEKK